MDVQDGELSIIDDGRDDDDVRGLPNTTEKKKNGVVVSKTGDHL